MNNKELHAAIASKLDLSKSDAEEIINASIDALLDKFCEGKTISVHGFGAFEVRHRKERLTVNPVTQERKIVPAKKALAFKPSTVYKDKIKQLPKA